MKYLIILFSIFILLSCSSKQVVTKYYILENYSITDDDIQVDSLEITTLPYIVEIRPFIVAKAYNQSRIALRTNSNELNYFYFHHWADLPGSAVTFFTWKRIHDSGLFKICEIRLFDHEPRYQINGLVEQIERIDMKKNSSAHLKMTMDLTDAKSGELILRHSFDTFVPMKGSAGMNVFARNVSQILTNEVNSFINQIYTTLKN